MDATETIVWWAALIITFGLFIYSEIQYRRCVKAFMVSLAEAQKRQAEIAAQDERARLNRIAQLDKNDGVVKTRDA